MIEVNEKLTRIIGDLQEFLPEKVAAEMLENEKSKSIDVMKLLDAVSNYVEEHRPADAEAAPEARLFEKIFANSDAKMHYEKLLEALG